MKNKAVLGAFLALALTAGAAGNIAFAKESGEVSAQAGVNVSGRNENHRGLGGKIGAWFGFDKEAGDDNDQNENENEHGSRNRDMGPNGFTVTMGTSSTSTPHMAIDRNIVATAVVTSINGSVITAVNHKDNATTTWTITTNADTKFFIRGHHDKNVTKSINDIIVGDRIGAAGTVTDNDGTERAITAAYLVQWNPSDKVRAAGTVLSVDSTNGTFVLDTQHKGQVTIQTDSSTTIKNGTSTGAFANITVGAKVAVKGMWNSLKSAINAVKIRIFQ
jgi:hypothetical protein